MEGLKAIGDALSVGVVISTLSGLLPPLAALVTILWIGFQFYHSAPMKESRKRRRQRHHDEL